jgi:DNA-binding transcriptional LysR family regulator
MTEPDLADLDAFAEVARHRSFRGAAAMRGTSASTLSEAVRRLETRLGVRLLNRTTRSVTPTEAGARLLERLAPALSEVAAAVDAVNGFRDSLTGTLRLKRADRRRPAHSAPDPGGIPEGKSRNHH